MDLKCIMVILLYINITRGIHVSTNNFPNSDEDSYDDDIEEVDTLQREVKDVKTKSPIKIESRYEVTENIVDVPNTTPAPGVANASFTVNKPLNHANPTNPNVNTEEGLSEDEKMYKQLVNNYYSILQIIQTHQKDDHEDMIDLPQFLDDFRDYLEGLREGFLHGVHNIRREVESEVEDSDEHGFLSGPFSYIKKLFKRRN